MTAVWLAPEPRNGRIGVVRPDLRLVPGGRSRIPREVARPPRAAGRVPTAVRRRSTLLGAMGLLLLGLALPLGGTGGRSHATGSALTAGLGGSAYTVRPGDSLWSIAERAAPGSDPRPLVAMMASRTGSDRVVPGERIRVP